MSQFHNFEDMHAWQEARSLIREIRAICKSKHVQKDYAFVDQITRSARSIAANIAEGNDARTRSECAQFLGFAKRSNAETSAHLSDALEEGYIDQESFDRLLQQSRKISAMLGRLIQYVRKK